MNVHLCLGNLPDPEDKAHPWLYDHSDVTSLQSPYHGLHVTGVYALTWFMFISNKEFELCESVTTFLDLSPKDWSHTADVASIQKTTEESIMM